MSKNELGKNFQAHVIFKIFISFYPHIAALPHQHFFTMIHRLIFIGLVFTCLALLPSCNKEVDYANIRLLLTDAPIDDPDIRAVMITVTEVRLNGIPLPDFKPITLDVRSLQNGVTHMLSNAKVKPADYNEITIVLDYHTDVTGNTPGCYIHLQNGVKWPLQSTSRECNIPQSFSLKNGVKSTIVMDFDLRKAIQHHDSPGHGFVFVEHDKLQKAIRIVQENKTGIIEGQCVNQAILTDKILVFAYQKGTFISSLEFKAQQALQFPNAISSAAVDANGKFILPFLNEGQYDLVFAACKDLNKDGRLDYQGLLVMKSEIGIGIPPILVTPGTKTSTAVSVAGLVPL